MISKLFVDISVGIVLILVGVITIRNTYKNPSTTFKYNDHGLYMCGAFSIIIGIACMSGGGGNLTESIYEELKKILK